MSSCKLLIITNRYPANINDGASPFVADFVDGLRQVNIDGTVLTPFHHSKSYDEDDSVVRFAWGEKHRTIGSLPKYLPSSWMKIARYMRSGSSEAVRLHLDKNFDLCLALWAAPSGIFARRLNRQFGLPYAVWCLGSDIHTYARIPVVKNMIIDVLKHSERMFSDGCSLGRMAEKLSGKPYQFLPSFRRIEQPGEIPDDQLRDRFVCFGRIDRAKGVFDLLEAFRIMADNNKSWSLFYIGDGPARKTLLKRIKKYDLEQRILAPGFLDTDEMFRVIGQARAVVIPSHADSLPLTFGEAMQLAKPVVVTDVGDLREFTEKYEVGVVVPPASPDHLAEGLQHVVDHGAEFPGKFDECVRELSIDRAVETVSEWINDRMASRRPKGAEVSC